MGEGDRRYLKKGVVLVVAWLLTLWIVLPMYVSFRQDGLVTILGSQVQGGLAVVTLTVLSLVPVVLFALAIHNLYLHLVTRRG
ncbi:MAG: hypothetical protein OEU36_20015 [Gammaproteobacteria bacterium]|nr:hypothetical protein [Gammaproteobacteria bacterium]